MWDEAKASGDIIASADWNDMVNDQKNRIPIPSGSTWGDIIFRGQNGWKRLAPDTGKFLKSQGANADPVWDTPAGGGGSASGVIFSVQYPAGSFYYPTDNPASLDRDTGSNKEKYRHLFDDTTEEFVAGQFHITPTIQDTDTVHLLAIGYARTAATGKNIQLKFYYSATSAGESWDQSYSSKLSGDKAVNGTQDNQDWIEWTDTVGNFGWQTNDNVDFKLSRVAPSANNLSGDWCLTNFIIYIKRE